MKNSLTGKLASIACLSILLAAPSVLAAGTTTWSGGGGANQNWSTAANWTTVGGTTPPGTGDAVVFRTAGGAGAAGTVNNIVDTAFTIGSLLVTNESANLYHTTQIGSGNTLTVSGVITVGGTNLASTYTVTGAGTLKGGSGTSIFTVAGGNGSTVTNDLSGLNNFIWNAGGAGGNFYVGVDPGYTSGATLRLAAASNNITATSFYIANNNSGGTSLLALGAGTNIINANTVEIGGSKTTGTLQFNSTTGGVRWRAANGSSGGSMELGGTPSHSGSSGSPFTGNVFLQGHSVDMLFSTLTVANRGGRSGNGAAIGNFAFDTGVVTCTNLNMAINSLGTNSIATVSAGGGTLNVVNSISLANAGAAPSAGLTPCTGSLIVTNGGTVKAGNIIKTTTAGIGNISVTNATLAITTVAGTIGTASAPIDTLNLSGATIHLNLDYNNPVTSITVNTNNASGINVITIDSIASASGTTTFTLLSYSAGNDPYSSLQLNLPFGYTGSLVDAAGQVQLTVTAPLAIPVTWTGITNSILVSSWDTNKTKNWVDSSLAPQAYANPDPVTFDDTAANGLVTVITTNTPSSFNINNNSLNYVFNGSGKISGSIGINKQGSASLTLADNGDDFTGGITVSGGTLILDNTNGNISGGLTIYSTAQIGNNDNYGALPAGAIDDEGALIFERADNYTVPTPISGAGSLTQNGNGVLTITGTNSYTGITVVSKGTLALTGSGSVSNSAGLLVSNATFNVSALSGTTLLNDFSITNATLSLSTTNLRTPLMPNTFEVDGIIAVSNVINITTLPAVASYPATITLIKSANPITLTAGNFNFALGSLPAASPAYAGSLSESSDGTSILLTLTAGPVGQRNSVTWAGLDNVTTTTNWSDRLDWQLPGEPGALDSVVFDSGNTTVSDNVTVNNYLDSSFTIAALTYNQTTSGQWHVTQIPAGTTLTVSGNTTVGGQSGDNARTAAAMVDAGTLVLNNNLTIGNNGTGGIDTGTILDLSGLSNFVFNASSGTITLGSGNRSAANFNLANASNMVTVATINANIASSSSSGSGTMTLGAGTNILNVGTFNIAAQRSSCTVNFPSGSTTGGLKLRGNTGTDSSRCTMTLGNRTASGSSGTTTGTLTLTGHPVDAKFATLTVGECTATTPNTGSGVMEFDTGTIDASNLVMALNTGTGTANSTVTVDAGATLIVGPAGLTLANQTSTGTANATFTLNGGTLICSNSILKATATGSTANLTLTGGSLNMVSGVIGTLPLPIDNLTLNGGTTIQLNVVGGVTNIAANNVSASGTTTINIAAFANVVGTTQLPLLHYNSGDPFTSLALGTTPAGYTSALIDNTANQTVDLIVTPPAPIIWKGSVSGNWDSSTLNWLNGASSVAYADGEYVQFDDSAATFNVNLTAPVAPAGVIVNDSANNYTFTGTGKITGLVGLTKQGSATLILDNSGVNDFTAGVNITAGTLQIGTNDANGNLPVSANVTDNGNLAFDRTDSVTVANVISGTGNVVQMGTGTNRLTGANTYTGNTTISAGMITVNTAATGNSALGPTTGAGSVIITNGGTLDVENNTANSISFTNTTDSAGKQFYIAGAGVGGNGAIVNYGTANQQNVFQNITLTGDATVGGPARWDMRVPDGKFQPILDLSGHTLTKTGSNQMSMVALIVTNGGNIIINSGTLSFETISSNSTTPITVNAGGVLGHFRQNATLFTAPITLNGGMIRDLNGTPGSTNDSPITLTANSFLDLNVGSADQVRLNGTITESGGSFGLTKTNAGSYSLSGVNTYSGSTMIVGGTLILADSGSISQSRLISVGSGTTFDASQRADQTLTLNAGQTVSGFGTVTGLVTTVAGSTIAPGSASAVGVLTFDNNVTLSGTNTMKVTHATAVTNDVVSVVNSTLTVGGTLNVSLLGSSFAAGDTFKLYSASAGLTVALTATNLPALPAGLGWDTTNLVNGVLHIIATVNPNPTNITVSVSGNTLNLSWPADHTGWTLQCQTNALGAGLNPGGTWFTVPGSTSVNTESITMDPTKGTVFYRLVLQ